MTPETSAAGDEVYGKPFHGWSCDCDECRSYDERGEPRPGEAPKVSAASPDPRLRFEEAVIDVCWKAVPYGETPDGDTAAYLLPKGAVHRLVGAAQAVGISAALRATRQELAEMDMVRAILEAACKRQGIPITSDVDPDKPARNYELMVRLGIGEVVGING